MLNQVSPFGTFSPSAFQSRIISVAREFDPGPFSKFAASVGKRLIFPGLTGPLDLMTWGVKMRIDPRRNVTEKRLMFSPSRFELEERELLRRELKAGDIFVDVGANVGAYSLWVGPLIGPNGKIVAIEPQPSVLARLRANFALNPDFNAVVFPCGAGEANSVMTLSVGSSNEGGASLATVGGGTDQVEVAVRPLISMIEEARLERIDALKIDIEGYEDRALLPFFDQAPKGLWPRLLILERSEKDWASDLMGKLKDYGYRQAFSTKRNYVLQLA
ncbi:MAG: FkbM family methyltransferase [Hyphomonadaceae bacterium]|jgi:FkbM family methyltransferase|uniref:FkbM family methyltransferase n=1 Tax=Aquidulcibacter sp. TaxID=2052990 RepID=UPI0022CAFFBC|nr:FkbM family methyltransferase [Aquidulcibacter sp.]MCE2891181.1 FkbM family methyltransferase [Hyphomonadaceae bacterium]MCZ8209921.1 FkbM family methyltransferase [Aquidulcibacter sp.]